MLGGEHLRGIDGGDRPLGHVDAAFRSGGALDAVTGLAPLFLALPAHRIARRVLRLIRVAGTLAEP